MSIIDAQLEFSKAQALTATAASTNQIDLGAARDVGSGEPMYVVVTVDVSADHTTGDETYQIDVQQDDNSSFSSATTLLSKVITSTDLTAGSLHVIPLPQNTEQYLRLNYTLGGTTPSVTLNAYLALNYQQIPNYASGYTVA